MEGEWTEYEYIDEDDLAQPDFYVDQFYPTGGLQDDMEDEMGGGLAPFSVSEIMEHCIEPTVTDGLKHMGKIIVWCLLFRIVTQSVEVVPWLCHAASVVSGTVLASHFFGNGVFYLLTLNTLAYVALALADKTRGAATVVVVVLFNFVAEVWVADPLAWHQVRGAVMILAMKVISLGFDMDKASVEVETLEREKAEREAKEEEKRNTRTTSSVKQRGGKKNGKRQSSEDRTAEEEEVKEVELAELPGWLEYCGYCLCPGTIVLGPWVSFQEYRKIFVNPRWNVTWLIKILFTVTFAFMFLTISTCWNPWLIPDSGWKWWIAYRDAMSFRASHYFVSFMSEAALIAAGFGCTLAGSQVLWHYTVTQPHNIEVPRSLVEVVISWNLPMHRWLKQYVFKQVAT